MLRAPCQNSLVMLAGMWAADEPHRRRKAAAQGTAESLVNPGLAVLCQWRQRVTEFISHLSCPALEPSSAWPSFQQYLEDERQRSALGYDTFLQPSPASEMPPGLPESLLQHQYLTLCFAKHSLFNACLCSSSHFVGMTKPCTTPA